VNILFDLDGTLTDPKEGIIACNKHALATLRRPVPEDSELVKFIGPPLRDCFREMLRSDEGIDAAVAAYRDRFTGVGMFENTVYEGIPEALESLLAKGARLFLVTSKPRIFAERILEHFDLARHFMATYGSELDGKRSDKGELIAYALMKSGLPPHDTVMVDDRRHDIIGARANSVLPAGVLWGYGSREELTDAEAEKLYEGPSELERIVVYA
jgi:phosphoglycolate phosphatase